MFTFDDRDSLDGWTHEGDVALDPAKGRKRPGLQPHAVAKVTYPGHNGGAICAIYGACFDPEEKLLYLYKSYGFLLSRTEQPPLVHVYQVK